MPGQSSSSCSTDDKLDLSLSVGGEDFLPVTIPSKQGNTVGCVIGRSDSQLEKPFQWLVKPEYAGLFSHSGTASKQSVNTDLTFYQF